MHRFPSFVDTIVSDAVIRLLNTTIQLSLYYYFPHNLLTIISSHELKNKTNKSHRKKN